jgi:hypothetical protein
MSDNVDDDLELEVEVDTEGDERDELEIAVGDEPQEPAPKVDMLEPGELAALRAQADSARAIKEGIEGLASRLAPQAQPANSPVQSPEEFMAEHMDDIFDKEKGPKLLAQYQKMVTDREYGPLIQSLSARVGTLTESVIEAQDPIYKDYRDEVRALVKSQPAGVQAMPDVFERAWLTIREKHRDEIEDKRIEAKVAERIKARDEASASVKPPVRINSDARASGGGGSSQRSVYRFKTEADKRDAEHQAELRGLTLSDYLKGKGVR